MRMNLNKKFEMKRHFCGEEYLNIKCKKDIYQFGKKLNTVNQHSTRLNNQFSRKKIQFIYVKLAAEIFS